MKAHSSEVGQLLPTKDVQPEASSPPPGIGNVMATILMLKSMIGCGWMAMASGFSSSGVTGGLLLAAFVTYVTIYGLSLVSELYLKVRERPGVATEPLTLQRLAGITLGRSGEVTVLVTMLTSQLAVGVAFLVYLSDFLHAVAPGLSAIVRAATLLPVVMALCQLRSMETLKEWSVVGIACVLTVMVVVTAYCSDQIAQDSTAPGTGSVFGEWSTLAEFYGICFFSMEGIFCYIPIIHTMAEPERAQGCAAVAVTGAASLYVATGLTGYLAFGSAVEATITDNMPSDLLWQAMRAVQAFSVLFTLPMQMFPVAQYADTIVPEHGTLSRIGIVLFVAGLPLAIPDMADILAVVGGLAMTTSGICIPILMHTAHVGGVGQLSLGQIVHRVGVCGLCVVLGVWASILAAYNMVEQ